VQTLFGGHGVFQHVQTNRADQLGVETARRDGDFALVADGFVRNAMLVVQGQLPFAAAVVGDGD